jgi:hypothetical protein
LLSLQQQLQQINTQVKDAAGNIDGIERTLCAIPVMDVLMLEPMKQQFIAGVRRFGLYSAVQIAVTVSLSNEPCRSDLNKNMAFLDCDSSFTQERTHIAT